MFHYTEPTDLQTALGNFILKNFNHCNDYGMTNEIDITLEESFREYSASEALRHLDIKITNAIADLTKHKYRSVFNVQKVLAFGVREKSMTNNEPIQVIRLLVSHT